MPYTIPTAEPFYFPGGSTGCLLLHGFTGSPKEMRELGEHLAGQGYTVLGIRLAAHATRPEDMLRAEWHDWVACVEDGWNLLCSAICRTDSPEPERIFILGLSMGGILSLLFASQPFAERYPLAGVVAMSTPYALRADPRLGAVELLSHIQSRVPKGPPDWRDPQVATDHVDYPYYPTRAIAQLRDLLVEMRLALPLVTIPVLLMHSRQDTTGDGFDPDSMQKIYDHMSSRDKQMLWIEGSGHVITRDAQRQQVFKAAAGFIKRVSLQAV
jgi:carboxylesterase